MKINPACAVGSVFGAFILLLVFTVSTCTVLYLFGLSTEHWPRLPRAVGWLCYAYSLGYVSIRLYPQCLKARLIRRGVV